MSVAQSGDRDAYRRVLLHTFLRNDPLSLYLARDSSIAPSLSSQ
jgi:hypothetical protein